LSLHSREIKDLGVRTLSETCMKESIAPSVAFGSAEISL
jgi:hypothetical protein